MSISESEGREGRREGGKEVRREKERKGRKERRGKEATHVNLLPPSSRSKSDWDRESNAYGEGGTGGKGSEFSACCFLCSA